MTTYNTYQEAKIENPECEIYWYLDGGLNDSFTTLELRDFDTKNNKCNPADCCMTVEKFLADGYRFVEGDFIIQHDGMVVRVCDDPDWNMKERRDNIRYILLAAALENIPTETPEEKEALDGVESAGEVEWKSGDECVISQKSKSKWLVVGVSPLAKTSTVCVSNTGELKSFHTDQLKKPETPQQRKDRERLENGKAIYDLMCSIELNHDIAGTPNTWGELRDEWQSVYIKLAEEVGHRKEKTNGTN